MKKKVTIIGGGTAGLFAAAFLDTSRFEVTVYDQKPTFGRKFLVAGDGGFNLTHAEDIEILKDKYTPKGFLDKALENFNNEQFREWLRSIGIPTFVGTSNRVFPEKGIKPITVLSQLIKHIKHNKVLFKYSKTFTGWDEQNNLLFNAQEVVNTDYTIFALGGSSWKITGADGKWSRPFKDKGLPTRPFKASNCAFKVEWPEAFINQFKGAPLKNIAISTDSQTQKGEAVITEFGLEGNSIYGLSAKIQSQLALNKEALIQLDFKPMLTIEKLEQKFVKSKLNTSQKLRKVLKLSAAQVALLKTYLPKEDFLNTSTLLATIKQFPLNITAAATIDEAISTTGGLAVHAIRSNFELVDLPNTFCIGEMLDWNAPTGGYLIQACVSMGVYVARVLNKAPFE